MLRHGDHVGTAMRRLAQHLDHTPESNNRQMDSAFNSIDWFDIIDYISYFLINKIINTVSL
jgi:hypothetical protein